MSDHRNEPLDYDPPDLLKVGSAKKLTRGAPGGQTDGSEGKKWVDPDDEY